MTSLASVPEGLKMLSDVALLAVPVLALAAARNPMIFAPGQVSATSHSFAAVRHTAPALPGGCWQSVLVPSQVSAVQGSPSSPQGAPALPAGCVHVALVPLHTSAVQGLPSSERAAPAGGTAPAGQALFVPSQLSAMSHGPAAARQTVPATCTSPGPLSAGHVTLVPVHFSGRSHRSVAARQTAPALPARC